MTASPLVSVIVPTYNRAPLLREAIASVLNETYTPWEAIVLDDGSTDETRAGLPDDPRVTHVPLPHTGNVAALRNTGLRQARGEYVVFLDSDDRLCRGRLDAQVARLQARPDCGWCHSNFATIDQAGNAIPRRAGPPWAPREGQLLRDVLTTDGSIALHATMVRRDLARRLRFDERVTFGDDYDFLIRLSEVSPGCAADIVAVEIREHPQRGSRTRYDASLQMALSYVRCRRRQRHPGVRAICRQRARYLLRHYLATARSRGELAAGVRRVCVAYGQSLVASR